MAGAAPDGGSAAHGGPGRGALPVVPSAWRGRRVLLGVTGGIAAYKAIQLARDLTLRGAIVDVVLTRTAREFVGAISFEGVTGRVVHADLVAEGHALAHIRLAREADVVCIAPATADFLARAAAGRADELITAILLATRAPVVICPAMNDAMWAHPATVANADRLVALGYTLLGPVIGPLAVGEGEGPGRLVEPAIILEHLARITQPDNPLRGRRVVVTAGPTREAVDPVRVLSNRSSGRMGYAIAAAAWRRGADVTLITGPTELTPPAGPRLVRIESADQMEDAVRHALPEAQVLVMAAAVADFRPTTPVTQKIRKSSRPDAIQLEGAPDVLASTIDARPADLFVVGFALESGDGRESAREKLERKALDLIVLNSASEAGAGFETETNRVVLIRRGTSDEELPVLPKTDVAELLLDRVAAALEAAS